MAKKWNIDDLPKPIRELIGLAREYRKARADRRMFEEANPKWWENPDLSAQQYRLTLTIKELHRRLDSAASKVQ